MEAKNNSCIPSCPEHKAWLSALQNYLDKEEKGKDYRAFLIEALLKDRIVVEQADWILERIGELSLDSIAKLHTCPTCGVSSKFKTCPVCGSGEKKDCGCGCEVSKES